MADVQQASWWEGHYAAGRHPWDLGGPAPGLVAWLAESALPRGRAVVLGAGRGHDAIALAQAGFTVTAVDFSTTAIAEARALAERAGAAIDFVERDLFELLPGYAEAFDLVFEHTCFCAIDPAQRPAYVEVAHGLLRPGGLLLAIFYTHGEPGGPPFTTSYEEIERLFSPRFELLTLRPLDASVPERRGLEKLGEFQKR